MPEITRAKEAKDKLQREARELRTMGNEFDAIAVRIAEHHVLTSSGPADTLMTGLIETTTSLHQSAKAILDKGPQYIDKIDSIGNTLKTSPETFANAAKLFRTFADIEAYADIAEDYRQVATLFDNLATRTVDWSTTLTKRYDRNQLLETLRYIRHQERFLERMLAALQAQDCSSGEMEALLRDIETYTKRFEHFRTQIRDINATFQGIEAVTTGKDQEVSPRRSPSGRPMPDPEPKNSSPNTVTLAPTQTVIKPTASPAQLSGNTSIHFCSTVATKNTPDELARTPVAPTASTEPSWAARAPAAKPRPSTLAYAVSSLQPAALQNQGANAHRYVPFDCTPISIPQQRPMTAEEWQARNDYLAKRYNIRWRQ